MRLVVMFVMAACAVAACSDTPKPPAPPSFPADYASTFKEARTCRQSTEHDLNRIRVLADPAAFSPYANRDAPFPAGAVLLKEEYDISDTNCTGPIKQWTLMKRLATGSSPKTLDWHWERVDPSRTVVQSDASRCYNCHSQCTPEVNGYLDTCTVPP